MEGEQVEDTIRILGGYSDVIVIRHTQEGGAERAAQVSPVPVINAGDGNGGQHPTQALLDLYTIYRERPLEGLSIAFIGELDRGRTARSLAYLLSKFERVKIFFVSPPEMQMKADILEHLDEHDVWYGLEQDASKVLPEVDVVYQTRIRPERMADRLAHGQYTIDESVLKTMKRDALILHPLPRTVELDKTVDEDPRALYFRQATQRAVRADGAVDDVAGQGVGIGLKAQGRARVACSNPGSRILIPESCTRQRKELQMQTQDYIDLENEYGAHNYHPLDVVIERAEGVWVYDVEGKRYLDCLAAYSAVNQGHCHPQILQALIEQAHRVTLTSRAFRNDQLPAALQGAARADRLRHGAADELGRRGRGDGA